MKNAVESLRIKFGAKVYDSDENSTYLSIRNWGNWEVPDDMMDDAEDCDFEVLTDGSREKLNKILNEIREKNENVVIDYDISEKNYINFTVREK